MARRKKTTAKKKVTAKRKPQPKKVKIQVPIEIDPSRLVLDFYDFEDTIYEMVQDQADAEIRKHVKPLIAAELKKLKESTDFGKLVNEAVMQRIMANLGG